MGRKQPFECIGKEETDTGAIKKVKKNVGENENLTH